MQVELHGIGDGDRLLLWRDAADGADALRMVVRPAAEPVDEDQDADTDSNDDVPLCRPDKRPRAAVDAAPMPSPSAPASPSAAVDGAPQPLISTWDGYIEPGCGLLVSPAQEVASSRVHVLCPIML